MYIFHKITSFHIGQKKIFKLLIIWDHRKKMGKDNETNKNAAECMAEALQQICSFMVMSTVH